MARTYARRRRGCSRGWLPGSGTSVASAARLSISVGRRQDAMMPISERSVKQWDVAAGALICERAGLSVLELAEYENLPWGIRVAPRAMAMPLLELVGGP